MNRAMVCRQALPMEEKFQAEGANRVVSQEEDVRRKEGRKEGGMSSEREMQETLPAERAASSLVLDRERLPATKITMSASVCRRRRNHARFGRRACQRQTTNRLNPRRVAPSPNRSRAAKRDKGNS